MCKVIIITTYWIGAGGGISIYNYNLYSVLKRRGCNVEVLYVNGNDGENSQRIPRNPLKMLWRVVGRLRNSCAEDECLVLVNGGWPYLLASLLPKGKKTILYIFHSHADDPYPIIGRLLLEVLLSLADRVLFVSRGLRENIEVTGKVKLPPQWAVLYGAPHVVVPSNDEVDAFKREFSISNSDFCLLGLGLTSLPAKARGAKLLMDVLKHLPRNVRLILTGKGKYYNELKEYAEKHKLEDRVVFPGYLNNPHVATLSASAYLHISYGEGLPLALLEVMSVGRPIVASAVMGIPEAIRHPLEGVLVDNSHREVSSAVLSLIENPKKRRKMSVLSRRAVHHRFSWEKTAEKLLGFSRGH